MKYLHIMLNEKFIPNYIKFLEKNFCIKDHEFYIIGGKSYEKIKKESYIKDYTYENKRFRKLLICIVYLKIYLSVIKSKKIILHGLFNPCTVIFFALNPWFLKKCNWVIWGGDLYCYTDRKQNSILKNLYYKIEDYVKSNMRYITYLTKEDYQLAKEYYNVKGIPRRGIYISPIELKTLEIFEKELKLSENLNIQIGNSADPENNHIEILEILKKYKNENIKIYAPLSYGEKEYALKIKQYGESIFKEKFVAILDFLKPDKYAEYLSNIDIMIFNHKRQQGLGNIFALGYLNKKIYLRNDISSWNYLTEDLKLVVYDIQSIENEEFETFKRNTILHNKEKIKNTIFSDKYIKKIWEENFNS